MLRRKESEQILFQQRLNSSVEEFAPLPGVAMQVLELVADPESTAADLETVLKGDVSLVAAVLKLANSAFYGLRRQVVSLTHALTLLGKKEVRNLVFARILFQAFRVSDSRQKALLTSVWKHSLECALAAEYLAEEKGLDSSLYFLGGMLHDIGKLLIVSEFFAEIEPVEHYGLFGGVRDLGTELSLLGCGHDRLGAQLLYRWLFPPSLVQMISEHHEHDRFSQCDPASRCLIVANLLSEWVFLLDWQQESGQEWEECGEKKGLLLSCGRDAGMLASEPDLLQLERCYRHCLAERADLMALLLDS